MTDQPDETWRPVSHFEGIYEVARDPDRVRSVDRVIKRRKRRRGTNLVIQHRRGHELRSRNHFGQLLVWLYDHEHRRHQRTVASLIAEAFGDTAA
ncbi:hypothetical protein GBQ45_25805 [Mycobacterium avium subsp. hominissuis]|uniref:hypothetical protein n=1 Tax=Mycobacterium avium TaxID=1764 RepID=UPI000A9B7805|nr:hypothetical protein [Mycobacterium avium]MBZ4547452.1 hypothetical protein [Mycobacterium avium subsp. hominissuis]MBZ4566832.1 hypothetical protein [Mycobacterium avium subsp. hominissuis]